MKVIPISVCVMTCAQLAAAPIPVANHGFETDFAADGTFPVGDVADWPAYDPQFLLGFDGNFTGVINPTGTDFFDQNDAPEGNNVALLFLDSAQARGLGPVGLRQELDAQLEANTTYTLIVEVGNIASGTGLPPFDNFGFYDLDGFPGYAVQLVASDIVITEDFNTLASFIPEGEFRTSVVSLVVRDTHEQINGTLEIRLLNLNEEDTPLDPGIEVDFDNVRLDATPNAIGPCTDADINEDALIGAADVADYLALLAAADPSANRNADGSVDAADLFLFLNAADAGCP
ncbi:MAG: hypothetical protein AAGB34_07730 [Planctomycetota bacterium]